MGGLGPGWEELAPGVPARSAARQDEPRGRGEETAPRAARGGGGVRFSGSEEPGCRPRPLPHFKQKLLGDRGGSALAGRGLPAPPSSERPGGALPSGAPGLPFFCPQLARPSRGAPAGPVPGSPRVSRARPRPQRSEEELAPGRALPRAAEEGGSLPLLLPHPPVNKNKRPRACRTRDAGEPRVR